MKDMLLISRDELREKLERGDNFRLVMVMGEWAFRAAHIPGSLQISTPEEALGLLNPTEEIVVYCSDPTCISSQYAYRVLERHGYLNLRRYAGGLSEWTDSGYPLEGEGLS